jgi:hypothetical protein
LHVIEVTDSRPAGVAPLADVEPDIRRLLRVRRAEDRIASEMGRLGEEIGSAERLEEVAAREGLQVASAFVSPSEQLPGLRPSPEFRDAVASLEIGVLSSPLRVAAGSAIVVVDEVLPASPAPFEDVKTDVSTAVVAERARTAALTAARDANDRHGDLAAVASALGQEVESSGALAPGQPLPGTGGPSPELRESLFGAGASEGDRGVVAVPSGAVVYRISRREPFDAQRFETEKAVLRKETLENRRNQYRQAIITQLKFQQQVEYNVALLDALEG